MWVRGLKPLYIHLRALAVESHPMWVRGLKLIVTNRNGESTSRRTLCGCVD